MRFLLFIVLLISFSLNIPAQEVEFYEDQSLWKKVKDKKAKFKRVSSQNGDTLVSKSFRIENDQILFERKWIDERPVGKWTTYNLNGELLEVRDYNALVYSDTPMASLNANDELDCENCTYAEFPGGKDSLVRYMGMNIRYPAMARDLNLTGTVFVEVSVDENGYPAPVRIIQSAHPYLDMECWKLVSNMPKWTPATKNGKPVSSFYKLPFRFNLR